LYLGDVFRVSPNELSFASMPSWKAIYGHQIPASKPTLVKPEFYEIYGAGFRRLCIGSERNPDVHSGMKKHLSAAFSSRALIEQESIVSAVLYRFVDRMGRDSTEAEGVNVTKWFEMVSFDVLAEMTFGESFGCIESGKTTETHNQHSAVWASYRQHFNRGLNSLFACQLYVRHADRHSREASFLGRAYSRAPLLHHLG
jgi:Cytochrome P450